VRPGRQLGLPPSQRQRLQGSLRPGQDPGRLTQLSLYPLSPRERPLRHGDGLVVAVGERAGGEPLLAEVDEEPVLQWIAGARGGVDDVGTGERPPGGDGQDGGDDEVDGDHVDDALGDPRELLQQAPGVPDDDRVGHAKAPDPTRHRLGQGGLDDRRADDRHRQGAPGVEQRPFTERLGVGVGVGPTEALGPGLADGHHAVLDPVLACLLGPGGEQRRARGAELGARRALEAGQHLGLA
jgi:hypothetical protein